MSAVLDAHLSDVWTAMPGIIDTVTMDATGLHAAVRLAHQPQLLTTDGASAVRMPLLAHCPLWFPRGGGCSMTFPVAPGDECLVVFASRSIDSWWDTGSVQPAMDLRSHALSDGIALVGLTSKPRTLANVSTTSAQLRSDDGSTSVDLNPTARIVTITAPGGIVLDGNVTVQGTVQASGDVTAGTISLEQHVHTGVESGGDETKGPVG